MRLDADERLTTRLVEELKQILPDTDEKITGYQVNAACFSWGVGYVMACIIRLGCCEFGAQILAFANSDG
jgi:hypothetical protein